MLHSLRAGRSGSPVLRPSSSFASWGCAWTAWGFVLSGPLSKGPPKKWPQHLQLFRDFAFGVVEGCRGQGASSDWVWLPRSLLALCAAHRQDWKAQKAIAEEDRHALHFHTQESLKDPWPCFSPWFLVGNAGRRYPLSRKGLYRAKNQGVLLCSGCAVWGLNSRAPP